MKDVLFQNKPYAVEVEAGQSCWCCTCGRSKTAPFCDGSHKASSEADGPVEYKTETKGMVYFCGCGKSADGVLCDGAHQKG